VVDPVKELLQIYIHYPAIPFIDMFLGLPDRIMGFPPRPTPVA
jgi:hypothetical protein